MCTYEVTFAPLQWSYAAAAGSHGHPGRRMIRNLWMAPRCQMVLLLHVYLAIVGQDGHQYPWSCASLRQRVEPSAHGRLPEHVSPVRAALGLGGHSAMTGDLHHCCHRPARH